MWIGWIEKIGLKTRQFAAIPLHAGPMDVQKGRDELPCGLMFVFCGIIYVL